MAFHEVPIESLEFNPFKKISKQWMLITAGDEKKSNTMTASWGGLGIMWGKNVATAYIRPNRYTKEFVDQTDHFTLSFLPEEERKALNYCGTVSGRDVEDKWAAAGLHPYPVDGTTGVEEAEMIFVCKKLYHQEMKPECFDAPENVAFVVLGLLYGEGDFGKSLIIANNCGEDTDCTCATLGALLGIIYGASGLPEKWTKPLDDKIVTMCIDKTSHGIWVPDTATELAERILRVVPGFLGQDLCDAFAEGGMTIECLEKEALLCNKTTDYLPLINGNGKSEELPIRDLCALSSYVARYQFPAFSVMVDYEDSVFFTPGENRKFKVKVVNSNTMREQQWVKIKLYLPEGVTAVGASTAELPLNNLYLSCAEKEFEINTEGFSDSRLELIVDVSLTGRHSNGPVKVVLFAGK